MASSAVSFDIIARDKATTTFSKIGKAADGSSSKLSKFGSVAAKAGKAAAFGLAAGAVAAGAALFDMAKAAIEDEASSARLEKALKNSADATDAQVAATETWITKMGTAFGVADDKLRPALEKLVGATGDVAKAQDLARLAMDISAGSGKSLESVALSLAKAQNGQVTGLAKLGVSMKDAEGKTVSFKEATGRLADTFGGQAAVKAKTLQGQMDRLKVQFDEAKESIGQKLLPILVEFADWINKKGIPAAQNFWEKMRDVFRKIREIVERVWAVVKPIMDAWMDSFGDLGTTAKAVANGDFRTAMERMRDLTVRTSIDVALNLEEILAKFVATMISAPERVYRASVNIAKKVATAFVGLPGKLKDIGVWAAANLIRGLVEGIANGAHTVMEAAGSLAGNVAGSFAGALGIHSPSRVFIGYGADIMRGLIKGIEKGGAPLQRALDKITAYIQKQGDRIADLMGKRSDIISSFGGFTSSVFTAEPAEGKKSDIDSLLKFQQTELAKAARLKRDTQKLLKAGLSRDLIQQLSASGESGLEQIHALAGGSTAQIQQLNALNAQTQAALTAAGTLAGNDLYASDIKDAKKAEQLAQAIAKALTAEQRKHPNQPIHIHLEGKEIVYSINKYQDGRGKDRPFP